jgi:hypothetical protein
VPPRADDLPSVTHSLASPLRRYVRRRSIRQKGLVSSSPAQIRLPAGLPAPCRLRGGSSLLEASWAGHWLTRSPPAAPPPQIVQCLFGSRVRQVEPLLQAVNPQHPLQTKKAAGRPHPSGKTAQPACTAWTTEQPALSPPKAPCAWLSSRSGQTPAVENVTCFNATPCLCRSNMEITELCGTLWVLVRTFTGTVISGDDSLMKAQVPDNLFLGRHFDRATIVLCVRWYLRFMRIPLHWRHQFVRLP